MTEDWTPERIAALAEAIDREDDAETRARLQAVMDATPGATPAQGE